MITFELDGWRVSRRIGVGDRELVRAGLLQVALINKEGTKEQIEACLRAAKQVGKTLRIYVNCNRLTPEYVQSIIFTTFSQHRDHDFMEENSITRERFSWVLGRSDIVVVRTGGSGDFKVLTECVKKVWNDNYGRHQLNEKTWRQTDEWCRQQFPQYYIEDNALWNLWNAK